LLELLSSNSVPNVQNGLIHALGLWLDYHIKDNDVQRRKEDAFALFERSVFDIARRRQYQRKEWPKNKPLPYPYNLEEAYESIWKEVRKDMRGLSFEQGLLFLAELWGRWMLICPEAIFRNSPEYASIVKTEYKEDELIEQMLRYLDNYGNM
jgi:hypothetical protein